MGETRRPAEEIWESKSGHIFMGACFNQKHGVRILFNRRWKRKTIKTEMCQRKHQERRTVLAGVCFHHTGYSDVHIEKMHTCIETQCPKHTTIIAGGFNTQLGLGEGSESDHVGKHALGESNKRGAWMKQRLMIPNCVALNTKFKTRTRNGRKVFARVLDARCMRRQPKQAELTC